MARHYTPATFKQLVAGPANECERARAVQHIASCKRCWSVAADNLAQRKHGENCEARAAVLQGAFVTLIEEGASYGIEELKARAWWAGVRDLSLTSQIQRIRSISALQNLAVFDVIMAEAWSVGLVDPYRGQELAQLGGILAEHLPRPKFSERSKNDLRGEAMTLLANFRRLAADWQGASAAITKAKGYLGSGSGEPGLEARLLSIHASLCSDTGFFEGALELVRKAEGIYRDLEDYKGLAHTTIQEANYLVAAHQPREAAERVRFALACLAPHELRLQVLARFSLVESLVMLGRPMEALRVYQEAKPMCDQADLATRLRSTYFEALLLEGLGLVRESERLFRDAIRMNLEHELFKEAFLTMLTLLEGFCRRGSLGKAMALCEAAIEATSEAGEACNHQIRRTWEELRDAVRVRQLSESELVRARRFLIRSWNAPENGALDISGEECNISAVKVEHDEPPQPAPVDVEVLTGDGYHAALLEYDRKWVEAALEKTKGNLSEASRVLGISRNTLRAKVLRYGL